MLDVRLPGLSELSWDALLFDFDGVLADTEPIHFACWRDLLRPFGIHLEWEFYQRNCIGVADRQMVERLASAHDPPIPWDEVWPQYQRKQPMFREKLMTNPPFLIETLDLIRDLTGEYKLAVVSSSSRTEVEPPIVQAGIRACFHAFVCGREAPNLKPAPDPYLMAAELLQAKRPLVIEDSDAGVASGKAAGYEVLRISSPDRVAQELRSILARPQFVQP